MAKYIEAIPVKFPDVFVDHSVIMPDHIHLLLRYDSQINSYELGSIIGWLKYQTTKECNIFRNTQGEKLWQRSYYDHIVRNDEDYREIWQYIENNPRKWALDRKIL